MEEVLKVNPPKYYYCDIDLKRIQYNSIGVHEADLLDAVKQWTKSTIHPYERFQ